MISLAESYAKYASKNEASRINIPRPRIIIITITPRHSSSIITLLPLFHLSSAFHLHRFFWPRPRHPPIKVGGIHEGGGRRGCIGVSADEGGVGGFGGGYRLVHDSAQVGADYCYKKSSSPMILGFISLTGIISRYISGYVGFSCSGGFYLLYRQFLNFTHWDETYIISAKYGAKTESFFKRKDKSYFGDIKNDKAKGRPIKNIHYCSKIAR